MGTLLRSRIGSLLLEYAIFLGAWMMLVSERNFQELLVGFIAAALATFASRVVQAEPIAYFSPYLGWLLMALELPFYAVVGAYQVLKGLALALFTREGPPSTLRAIPFDVGGDDGRSQARRALALTYTTSTPNSVVLGIDRENRMMLYHQVVPGKVLRITRRLGARG